jgi:hypothetical protein
MIDTTTTQGKFTRRLAALAEARGLELVDDRQWGNTGTFRIEAPDSFRPVLAVSYAFHTESEYDTLEGLPPRDLGRDEHGLYRHDELDGALSAVAEVLDACGYLVSA